MLDRIIIAFFRAFYSESINKAVPCNLASLLDINYVIDDPGERIAKLRGSIRIYTESPLQTQWRRVKPGDSKTLAYVLINWPFSLVTGVRYFHIVYGK